MRRFSPRLLIVLAILVIADIIAATAWFQLVAKDCQSSGENSDVAVVFMGPWDGDFGVGKDTMRRIDHALELYHDGLIDNIVCAGGSLPRKGLYGAEDMKRVFVSLGVPEEHIYSERLSYDSQSDWEEARKIINSNNWNSVRIVSSAIHLPRLQDIITDKNLSIIYSPYPYDQCQPEISCVCLWWQINYEWLALVAATVLPDSVYRPSIRWLRERGF
ncbi:hypothetical protein ES703_51063 [subsurface metagenome]